MQSLKWTKTEEALCDIKNSKLFCWVNKAKHRILCLRGYLFCKKRRKLQTYICIYFYMHKETLETIPFSMTCSFHIVFPYQNISCTLQIYTLVYPKKLKLKIIVINIYNYKVFIWVYVWWLGALEWMDDMNEHKMFIYIYYTYI